MCLDSVTDEKTRYYPVVTHTEPRLAQSRFPKRCEQSLTHSMHRASADGLWFPPNGSLRPIMQTTFVPLPHDLIVKWKNGKEKIIALPFA